jgi:hypothetical protein
LYDELIYGFRGVFEICLVRKTADVERTTNTDRYFCPCFDPDSALAFFCP